MRCVVMNGYGGPEVLALVQRQVPVPGPGEVLIRVAAAGMNFTDTHQRRGASAYADSGLRYGDPRRATNTYRTPEGAPADILGIEVSGTVAALGPDVAGLLVGQRVCALIGGGGYAEYAVAAASLCLPVPDDFDLRAAGGLPETLFTVWDAVFMRGRFSKGESILVHGGGSGIGTMTIMLAKIFGASRIFATARGAEKGAVCRQLGCDRVIDYTKEDFAEIVIAETNGSGVDVVFDMVGSDYFDRNLACLAYDGRHISIATISGARTELDIRAIMAKRLMLTGSSLRPRSIAQKAVIADDLRAKTWPLVEKGQLKPWVHAYFRLEQVAEAHRLMDGGSHIGKLILTP